MAENKNPGKNAPQWSVQVMKDGKEIASVPLGKDKCFIGRMSQNQIMLDHPSVSRSHALISFQAGKYFVIDQGSQNGTVLNGRVIFQEEFKAGDIISIGPFSMKLVEAAAGSAPKKVLGRTALDGDMTSSFSEFDPAKKVKK